MRNSRDPDGPVLRFTRAEMSAFLGGTLLGDFDQFGTQLIHVAMHKEMHKLRGEKNDATMG